MIVKFKLSNSLAIANCKVQLGGEYAGEKRKKKGKDFEVSSAIHGQEMSLEYFSHSGSSGHCDIFCMGYMGEVFAMAYGIWILKKQLRSVYEECK